MPENRYSISRIKSASSIAFAKTMGIYEKNIKPSLRTDSNEIAYWLERNNQRENGEFFCLCFTYNDEIVGYAQFIHFSVQRIIFFDYLVLDENFRKNNLYYEFIEQIKEYIEKKKLYYDYILAEVGNVSNTEEPSEEAKHLIRLFKLSGFKVARIKYYQPPLGISNFESDMPATLMVYSKDNTTEIKVKTILRIIHTIFYQHYVVWYSMYDITIAEYQDIINLKYKALESMLNNQSVVKLNGYRVPPETINTRNSNDVSFKIIFWILLIMISLFFFAMTTFLVDKYLEIPRYELIMTIVAFFFLFVIVLSVFRTKTIQWLELAAEYLKNFFSS